MKLFLKRNKYFAIITIALLFSIRGSEINAETIPWTWTYTKSVPTTIRSDSFEFVQHTPLFTQLIVSWYAHRPVKGHFTLWGQLRDAVTGKWLTRHKLMVWGADIQQSFPSLHPEDSKNFYVRLEMPKGQEANGFKIIVQAHDGALIADLKQLFVNISNQQLFKEEDIKPTFASIMVKNVPRYSQMLLDHPRSVHMCSPTATAMLVHYCLQQTIDPLAFALKVYDKGLDTFGSWPFNCAHANEQAQGRWSFYTTRLSSFKELYELLQKNIPVVVSIRGPLPGSAGAYAAGHLVLVVGYDALTQEVLCHDPAFASNEETYTAYPYKDFIGAWEKSRRLAYKAEKGIKR